MIKTVQLACIPCLLMAVASCTTRQAGVTTGHPPEEQQNHMPQMAQSVGVAINNQSISLWRDAVAKATRDAVNAGETNLTEVTTIVCGKTQEEEQNARQVRLCWVDAFSELGAQAAKNHGAIDESLAAQVAGQSRAMLHEASLRRFTEQRDDLIEQHFHETQKESQQIGAR